MNLPELWIMTCRRDPPSLGDTLRDMFAKDELVSKASVHIAICGTIDTPYDASAVEFANEHKIVRVAFDSKKWSEIANASIYAKNVQTGLMMLELGSGDMVYLQDDLLFAKNWLATTMLIKASIEKRYGPDFLLTLYAPQEFYDNRGYAEYQPQTFYGAQAVFVPAPMRARLIKVFRDNRGGSLGYDDMVMKHVLLSKPFPPLFAILPDVVQHMGKHNSVTGCPYHWSPSFVEHPG